MIILLWAVYSFFQSVETAFNRIWNVKRSRSILRQVTTYIAIVVLIPVLIVCSAGINILVHTTVESTVHTKAIIEYFQTGLVPRFPTLIMSGFIAMLAMLLWVGGVILEVISRNNWKQYELMLMHYDKTSTVKTEIKEG